MSSCIQTVELILSTIATSRTHQFNNTSRGSVPLLVSFGENTTLGYIIIY